VIQHIVSRLQHLSTPKKVRDETKRLAAVWTNWYSSKCSRPHRLHNPPHGNSSRRPRLYPQPQHAPYTVVAATLRSAISIYAALRPQTVRYTALDHAMRMVIAGSVVAQVEVLDNRRQLKKHVCVAIVSEEGF
jgi:hypothetical protein